MRVRQEVAKVKQMWLEDSHFRTRIQNGDNDLASALESGDQRVLEKLVFNRLKEQMDR